MKYLIIVFAFTFVACQSPTKSTTNEEESATDFLVKVENEDYEVGFINENGKTIIPFGKYQTSFSDTITTLGFVMDKNGKCIGIDKNDNKLFQVYWFDNGPDYVEDGLFRIVENDKIGYANMNGEIIIQPQFKCANPFENGQAKVAMNCTLEKDGEYTFAKSENWYFIDKEGNTVD